MAEQFGEERGVRLLLVEDDPLARRALARLLTLEGFAVETAGTLAEAYAKLDGQSVALLDLNLPDGLGTELLARIRAGHPGVVVAILSGAPDVLVAEALLMGPDLVMRKPADVSVLLEWLRAWRHGQALDGH